MLKNFFKKSNDADRPDDSATPARESSQAPVQSSVFEPSSDSTFTPTTSTLPVFESSSQETSDMNNSAFKPASSDDSNRGYAQGSYEQPQQSSYGTAISSGASSYDNSAIRNVLNDDVKVEGDLKFTDDLLIDGYVKGTITSDGALTIGESGQIYASINTRSVVIHGTVHGNITVTEHLELKANSKLIGDVVAKTIAIEKGAVFLGRSTVGSSPDASLTSSSEEAVAQ